jgi:hypothetical protein
MYIFDYYKTSIAKLLDCEESLIKFWWDRHDNKQDDYVLYQTEDLIHSHKRDDYMSFINNAKCVYDYSTKNLSYHSGEFRPFLPKLDSQYNEGYKDIDVLFYGGMSNRRREIINSISTKYNVTYVEKFTSLEEHKDAIRRSNYVLSIGYYDNIYNDFWRVTPALDFGANILLETNEEVWSIDFLKNYFNNRIKFI